MLLDPFLITGYRLHLKYFAFKEFDWRLISKSSKFLITVRHFAYINVQKLSEEGVNVFAKVFSNLLQILGSLPFPFPFQIKFFATCCAWNQIFTFVMITPELQFFLFLAVRWRISDDGRFKSSVIKIITTISLVYTTWLDST